jgi:UDP-N-acetylmuramoyl-tripeptide--D-alanyl-D-alanine ligase
MNPLFDLFYQSAGICTDTRKIKPDSLYVALKGANFDGNEFVQQALDLGAKFAVTERQDLADSERIFYTQDNLEFLQSLANFHRKKLNIPVLAITGSNGKTTTKELIYRVLSKKYKALCTQGNLNNHLGVPLTLLELTEIHEIAIIEMGANKPGDIRELVEIAEPDYGIITNIGAAHIEGFGSLEGVVQTKSELYNFLKTKTGLIFVNGDDPILNKQLDNYFNKFTYGQSVNNTVHGHLLEMTPFIHFTWQNRNGLAHTVRGQMIGSYNLINYLCAAAVGVYFELKEDEISSALEEYKPTNNRSQIVKTTSNTIIMDAYNANISSMRAALESFEQIKHENKCVILGDMRELGLLSPEAHQEIVDYLASKNWSIYLVGIEFSKTRKPKSMQHFNHVEELVNCLDQNPIRESLVLIKGSRSMALEKLEKSL